MDAAALGSLDTPQNTLKLPGIGGVDSCENGVCVPAGIHRGLHRQQYMKKVADRIEGLKDPEEIRAELRLVKGEIYAGDPRWIFK